MTFKKGNKPWNKGKKINNKPNYGMTGKKHSEESREKMKISIKNGYKDGREPWNKGINIWTTRKHPHQGKKIWKDKDHPKGMLGKTAWNKGLKGAYLHSEESKLKIKNNNAHYWKGKPTWITGKHHSEETKKKIGLSNAGLERSEETRKKIKKARAKQIFPLKDSSIELKIQDFLTALKIEFVTHKYMNIKNSYQCDIFIPIQNGIIKETIIEADGEFFHMNPEKYSAEDKIFKNGMTAKERWKLDNSRTKELIEKGFNVIRLWENDIRVMNINDFKNKLLEIKI